MAAFRPTSMHDEERLRQTGRSIWGHFVVNLGDQMAYLGEFAFGGVILAVFLFILTQLWQVTFRSQGVAVLGGFTATQMTWYLVFTEAFVLSRVQLARKIDEEVRTGDLAYALLRPGGYLAGHFGAYLAERTVRFAMALAVGSGVAMVLVGPVSLNPAAVLLSVGATVVAMVLEFLLVVGIGLGAFWIDDTRSIYLIYTRVSMILGGLLLPLDLFPDPLAAIARLLPFGAMIYGPSRLALDPDGEQVATVLITLVMWIAPIGFGVGWIYKRALTRTIVHGG